MKKVGIVSCYFKHNYGSMLQAYATKRFLDNKNIPNETIRIDCNKDFKKGKLKYYLSQIFNFSFIKSKFGMIKLKFDRKTKKDLNSNISIRDRKYEEFKKEFNLSINCTDYKGLTQISQEKYSDVIVGSDQLWLPVNVVSNYYTLNWVPDNINKVSYSTSFGVSEVPTKYNKIYNDFLNRINFLSVREESGLNLVKKLSGRDAKLVCDPTILLTKEEWEAEAYKDRIVEDKYILCYFLGSNIEHRKFAERLKEKTGYKIVSLNHADEYVKYSDKFCDVALYDIGPREWISLIRDAEYVCTDSFHGTVFSLIFNKSFFNFRRYNSKNKNSTNSRLDSLLNIVEISKERILTGNEDIDKVLNFEIDFNIVNDKLNKFRIESGKWLLDALTWRKEEENVFIDIKNKEMCTGCTACKSICPKDAIEMVRDEEGFLYPKVDRSKCVNCGLCKKTCPILFSNERNTFKQEGFIFQYNDDKIRLESTSGGAFTAIAQEILSKQGVVYGVGFDDKFKVKHLRVDSENDLYRFRNSKYVQSDPNDTFRMVKEDLNNSKLVLYSGTVCQIEGLKAYLKKDYSNLYTVDVICRAVPSPMLWEKYFDELGKPGKIDKVKFREKLYGYKYSNFCTYENNKILYHNGIDTDPYLRAFFSNIASRPSCYECKYKNKNHISDFTIWDCFDVDKFDKSFDDDKGTTRILINSYKASLLFNNIKDKHNVKKIDDDILISNFHQMFNSIRYNSSRAEFFDDLNRHGVTYVNKKYFPNNIKCKIEKYLRIILIKLGVYKPLIKVGKKIRKRT